MNNGDLRFALVALALPVNAAFHYQIPPHLQEQIEVGTRVLVPFGKRKATGYVIELIPEPAVTDTKPIEGLLDPFPLFSPGELKFFRWIAAYYCAPLGEVIKGALPPGINVKTSSSLSLTPGGQDKLTAAKLTEPEERIIALLGEKKGITLRALMNVFKERNVRTLVSGLLHKGYACLSQGESTRIVKPRTEKVYAINRDAVAGFTCSDWKRIRKKAPRQFEVLAWVQRKGTEKKERNHPHMRGMGSFLRALEKKNFIVRNLIETFRKPSLDADHEESSSLTMTREQAEALERIVAKVREKKYAPFLLHGITGSGKTEVYLRAIETTLATGRGAIMMVPEIALTPQLIARFQVRFGNKIAQIHSGLSPGERFDEWRRIHRGEAPIVVGARSAIFAPLKPLGIIIVDEEHDPAYKQDERRCCYNARDLSLVKGQMNKAVVVLGSATPSLETFYNTRIGKIDYLHLSQRIDGRPLPQVEVVDMRIEERGAMISSRLKKGIEERWSRGEQTLLFLNRRGFARFVLCAQCGYTFRCPNCDVSLIYHQQRGILCCHYCNFSRRAPENCPNCKGGKLEIIGFGTERLEMEIRSLFPSLRVGRLDRDTTSRKNALQMVLKQFRKGEIDLLIGTQMVAMGHDVPGVTLVGVIAADHSLNFPDFRAGERTFQLLTQVAGRSGRGHLPGEVIIQTYNPHHPGIHLATKQDFLAFYEEEIFHRRELNYPPFSRLVNFRVVGNSRSLAREYAAKLGRVSGDLREKEGAYKEDLEILGPAEAPWEKLKGKYRWQMLVKGRKYRVLHEFTEGVVAATKQAIRISGVTLHVDIDPLNLL